MVTLTWNSPGTAALGLLSYNLYRDYVKIDSGITALTTTDDLAGMPYATYTYHVTAVYAEGESGYSNGASVDYTQVLEPVTDVTAIVSGANIELSWTASTGATSYNVYRISDPFATPTPSDLIGTPTSPAYTDENILLTEAKAFYVIVAVN